MGLLMIRCPNTRESLFTGAPVRHSRGRSGQAHKAAQRVTERDCGDLRAICRALVRRARGCLSARGFLPFVFGNTPAISSSGAGGADGLRPGRFSSTQAVHHR